MTSPRTATSASGAGGKDRIRLAGMRPASVPTVDRIFSITFLLVCIGLIMVL